MTVKGFKGLCVGLGPWGGWQASYAGGEAEAQSRRRSERGMGENQERLKNKDRRLAGWGTREGGLLQTLIWIHHPDLWPHVWRAVT